MAEKRGGTFRCVLNVFDMIFMLCDPHYYMICNAHNRVMWLNFNMNYLIIAR